MSGGLLPDGQGSDSDSEDYYPLAGVAENVAAERGKCFGPILV